MAETTFAQRVAEILANPAEHGFTWIMQALERDKVELPPAPILETVDVSRIMDTFPELVPFALTASNSPRVKDQGIVREALWKNRKVSHDELKRLQVEWRLGVKAVRTAGVAIKALDGKLYSDEMAANQANLAFLVDLGLDVETAKAKLGLK